MKVTLTTQGGFAAGIRRPPRVLETKALPEAATAELEKLIAAAKSSPMAKEPNLGHARDAMTYTITVDHPGGEQTVISQADTAFSSSFAALIQWLEQHLTAK